MKKIINRRQAKKIIGWQLIIISILMNGYLARQIYDVRCQVNGEIVGYFIKATTCDDLYQAKMDSLELSRLQYLITINNKIYDN